MDATIEQHPGESPVAFEARSLYLNSGAQRSIRKVAAQLGKKRAIVGRWCKQWRWVASAKAWDEARAELAAKASDAVLVAAAETTAARLARRREELPERLWATFDAAYQAFDRRLKQTSVEGSKPMARRELQDRAELVHRLSIRAERALEMLEAIVARQVPTGATGRLRIPDRDVRHEPRIEVQERFVPTS